MAVGKRSIDNGSAAFMDFVNEAILSRIISLLSFRDRVKVERVCKSWQKVSLEVNQRRQTALAVFGQQCNRNLNPNFCSNPAHKINKSEIIERNWYLRDLRPIFKRVPRLRSLHLKADDLEPILTNEEVAELTTLLPDLEHFSIIDDKIGANIYDDVLEIVRQSPKMIHLEMKFPVREGTGKTQMLQENLILKEAITITKEQIEVLSTNVPIGLTNCKLISNACSKLTKLSVLGNSVSKASLEALFSNGICRGKYLRTLNINVDNEDQLQTIASNMLRLKNFHCVIDEKCDVYDISTVGQLKNLNHLFLSCWTKDVLDAGLVRVFIGCKELTSLIITGEVSDKSFELLSNFCTKLRRVELNNSSGDKITDRTMYAFQKLDYLQSLSIYGCDASDGSVINFFDNCSKYLNYFRIQRSATLSKAVLPSIIEYAQRKKKGKRVEKVTIILPTRLQEFWPRYLEYDVPKNLVMKFEVDTVRHRRSLAINNDSTNENDITYSNDTNDATNNEAIETSSDTI